MTITIEGEQSQRNVDELRLLLLDAITPGERTVLDISGVTIADIALVQLVESARLHARAVGAQLCLVGPTPQPVLDVLDRAGFTTTVTQFWIQGAQAA